MQIQLASTKTVYGYLVTIVALNTMTSLSSPY